MKKTITTFIFAFICSSSCFAGEYLMCQASGVHYYAGYSIDLSKNLQGELSPRVQLPIYLKNYTMDVSKYKDLLRITLTNTKTGLRTWALGDLDGYQHVMLYHEVSNEEAQEIGLLNGSNLIYVDCYKSTSSNDIYKPI